MQHFFIHIRAVLALLLFALPLGAHAQKKAPVSKKDTVYKNKVKHADTLLRIDPGTGNEYYKGKIVYSAANMPPDRPGLRPNTKPSLDDQGLMKYLLDNLADELKKLPDADYYLHIRHIIIDDLGNVVHFENKGISSVETDINGGHTPAGADAIMRKIALILNAVSCKPACVNSTFVPYMLQDITAQQPFTIKDHKAIAK